MPLYAAARVPELPVPDLCMACLGSLLLPCREEHVPLVVPGAALQGSDSASAAAAACHVQAGCEPDSHCLTRD